MVSMGGKSSPDCAKIVAEPMRLRLVVGEM